MPEASAFDTYYNARRRIGASWSRALYWAQIAGIFARCGGRDLVGLPRRANNHTTQRRTRIPTQPYPATLGGI